MNTESEVSRMTQAIIENPVINSPFQEPSRHEDANPPADTMTPEG